MPKSLLNDTMEFDEKHWVISIFNSGSTIAPHAVLLVEGVEQKNADEEEPDSKSAPGLFSPVQRPSEPNYFVGQYEIFAITLAADEKAIEEALRESKQEARNLNISGKAIAGIKKLCKNEEGCIVNINVIENRNIALGAVYTRPGGYTQYKSQCRSFRQTAQAVQAMCAEIRDEAERIISIWQHRPGEVQNLLPKYQYRGKHHPLGEAAKGLNCTEWCYDKLNIARRIDEQTELMRSKPPKPCCIL